MNDILIYFDILKKHEQHVTNVLRKLRNANLKVKLKKSTFHTKRIVFLKFVIILKKIQIQQNKLKIIKT